MNFLNIYNNCRKFWYWPSLKEDIRQQWERCEQCLECKKSKTKSPPLFPIDIMAFHIGECWSVDLFKWNKKHFILGIDKVSQLMMLEMVPNQMTQTISKVL